MTANDNRTDNHIEEKAVASDAQSGSSGELFAGAGSTANASVHAQTSSAEARSKENAQPADGVTSSAPSRAEIIPPSNAGEKAADPVVETRVPWYKHAFFRKIGYALAALLIAVTIWGYVLMTENPARTKRIEDVRLSVDGGSEAGLRSRNLIISDEITSSLPSVAVNIRTTLNDLPRFNSALGEIVSASINLNDIRSPGVYELPISATSTIGTPISIEPSTITITVDNYVTRSVPITYSFVNSLPDGYWHNDPTLTTNAGVNGNINISGAEEKISSIVKANCVIDLSERMTDINESFVPELMDEDQNVLDKKGVIGAIPAVTVRMSIRPYVELELQNYLLLSGEINENYELTSISVNPPTFSIAAPQDEIESVVDSIYLEPINVTNLYPGTHTQRVTIMGFSGDSVLLSDNNFFVTIEVADKTVQRAFTIPISDVEITGENTELFNYLYGTRTFTVQLVGPARIVNDLAQSSIRLSLDVSGFARGTHEITPKLAVDGDPSWLTDGSVSISVQKSFCTVTTATG